ncbi:hypothetical protein I5907_16895 [Panacibacter sp. DH6]|uniref:Uncharacterized protein n=1 Tax=Panacibacter microcysteis TaxID=2793269 RepID=A0A931GYY2_9BACT|nr:hypothetical protein [Panacibacter microcysteis]MBG9377921.1 hypothetical protein [Panacibacter microcysteis]
MKFFVAILLTALLGHAAPLFFPWWSFAITSFVVAVVVHQKAGLAFVSGFFGVFLLFIIHTFIIDYTNDHLLSKKVAEILKIGSSAFSVMLLSAFVGGLISSLAALSGSLARGKAK